MRRGVRSAAAAAGALVSHTRRTRATAMDADEAIYYGAHGRGIGERMGIDEVAGGAVAVPGCPIDRIALFSERHETLRRWATEANWRDATTRHKTWHFLRTENLTQEAVVDRVRQHYQSCTHEPGRRVQAALYRCDGAGAFASLRRSCAVARVPTLVDGVYDEKVERCIVDFANCRLGGAWLSYGMVQEEKLFIERPDLGALCARALVALPEPRAGALPPASPFSMRPNEAWLLRGAPAYASVGWYGRTPPDALERLALLDPSEDGATSPTVVAIDAIRAAGLAAYERAHLDAMLRKAYVGFAAARHDTELGGHRTIATGNWGCGAFGNNERVALVVQSLAADLAGVRLRYHLPKGLGGEGAAEAGTDALTPALEMLEHARAEGISVEQVSWLERLEPHGSQSAPLVSLPISPGLPI